MNSKFSLDQQHVKNEVSRAEPSNNSTYWSKVLQHISGLMNMSPSIDSATRCLFNHSRCYRNHNWYSLFNSTAADALVTRDTKEWENGDIECIE
jgi:hypothetical protein